MFDSRGVVAVSALFVLVVGCVDAGDEKAGEVAPPVPTDQSAAERAAVQATIDAYVSSVVDRQLEPLSSIVSDEILTHGTKRGIELETFLERQRASLFRTFQLSEDARPRFEVADVVAEGQILRVTLRFRGETLKKPFYLVREAGELKLNIAKPGFSRALRSTSSYQVRNNNHVSGSATMLCVGNSIMVQGAHTGTVSCTDTCGWWSGTDFAMAGSDHSEKCDWNSWGDDVIIDGLYGGFYGWYCNDNC